MSRERENRLITGARETIVLLNAQGSPTAYQMSPMSDVDIAEVDLWIQQRYIAQVDHDKQQAATLSAFSGIGAEMMDCDDGFARLLWQAIHRSHPLVTYSELLEFMRLSVNKVEFNARFNSLNAIESVSKKGAISGKAEEPIAVDKAAIYRMLAKMYNWTFAQIAAMTSFQQLKALSENETSSGESGVYFETEEQYNKWLADKAANG